jgi:hypothetical protein
MAQEKGLSENVEKGQMRVRVRRRLLGARSCEGRVGL